MMRKLPARDWFWPFLGTESRLIQTYAEASGIVPDWAPIAIAWERPNGTWTLSDEAVAGHHAKGGAVLWVSKAGVSKITTKDGESVVSGSARPDTNSAPYSAVAAFLPATETSPNGEVVTRNVIGFGSSTQWPTQAEWTSRSRIQLRIFNPSDSGVNLYVGPGVADDLNQKGQPDVVPPGSEWVSDLNDIRPVYVRADAGVVFATVESRKVA